MPIDTSQMTDDERMQFNLIQTMTENLPDEALDVFIQFLQEEKARRGL